jgi:DNA-binding MarR family transcriptional regulator
MMKNSPQSIIDLIAKIRERSNLLIEQELSARGLNGVVPAHGSVFAYLFQQHEPVPIMAVVKQSGRAKSTITGIVKTLEKHGYIYRQPSEQDARSVDIGLTEKGWAVKQDFEEISALLLDTVYGDMAITDREHLVTQLSRIEANLR